MGPAQRERAEVQHSKITEQKAAEEVSNYLCDVMLIYLL